MSESKLKAKLAEQDYAISTPEKHRDRGLFIWIGVVVIVLIIGSLSYFLIFNKTTKKSSDSQTQVYKSNAGFSINFPSKPTVSQATTVIYKGKDKYSSYTVSSLGHNYVVRKYDLSNSINTKYYDSASSIAFLKTWVNAVASGPSKWIPISNKQIKFDGQDTLSSTLTGSSNGQTDNVYFYSFLDGENMYNIFTEGVDQTDAYSFINSFKLN